MSQLDFRSHGEELWKAAFFEASHAMVITTLDARISYVNSAATRLLRSSAEELVGQGLFGRIGTGVFGVQQFTHQLERPQNFLPSQTISFEAKSALAGGKECDLKLDCVRIKVGDSDFLHWSLQDVTDFKSSDKLLDFFGQTLRSFDMTINFKNGVLKGAQSAVQHLADWCRIDVFEDSKLIMVGAAHRDRSLEELIWTLDKKHPPSSDDMFSPHKVVRTGTPEFFPQALDVIDRDRNPERLKTLQTLGLGSYICVPIRVSSLVSGCLTLASIEPSFTNIDLVMAEELATKFGLSLERAAYFRGLEELKKAAEAANISRTHFLANISREMRVSLGDVLGLTERLLNSDLSEENRTVWGEKIQLNGKRLIGILDDILELSKVEVGRLEIENTRIDLKKFVSDVYGNLARVSDEKGVKLNFIIESPLPCHVTSDEVRLKQVLSSVIGSALKRTSAGGVTVKIKILKSDSYYSQLCFEISDTGEGLTEEQVSHLFQPFSQEEASLTGKFEDIGLGLALARRLARRMGGDVVLLDSHPERGSVFLVAIDPGSTDDTPTFDNLS